MKQNRLGEFFKSDWQIGASAPFFILERGAGYIEKDLGKKKEEGEKNNREKEER